MAKPAAVPERWAHLPERFQTYLTGPTDSPHTQRAYASRVRTYLVWLDTADLSVLCPGDPTECDPITDGDAATFAVRDYRAHLQTVRKASPDTVNAHLTALAAFYTWLGVPMSAPKHHKRGRRAPEGLDGLEVKRLSRAAEKLPVRDRAIVALLRLAGLRVSELVALDVDDVPVTARKGKVIVRRGKGAKYRDVPMPPELRTVIQQYVPARREQNAAGEHENALLLTHSGERMSEQSVRKLLLVVGESARIEHLTPHRLRHTYGTEMVRDGADLVIVADLMGHDSIETTRGYTSSTEADRERAVGALYSEYEQQATPCEAQEVIEGRQTTGQSTIPVAGYREEASVE